MTAPSFDGGSSDARESIRILARGRWVILACVIVIPSVVLAISLLLPKTYESTVVLQITNSSDPTLLGGQPANTSAADVAARLIATPKFSVAAAKYLKPPPKDPRGL